MASRELHDLTSTIAFKAERVLNECLASGVEILIYCTLRSVEEQARLYRNGRSLRSINKKAKELRNTYGRHDLADLLIDVGPQYGSKIVTYAGPGQSMHNYHCAFDAVPIVDGKLQWSVNSLEWITYGDACAQADLEWAGTWSLRKREYPHAQDRGVSWRDLIRDYDHA